MASQNSASILNLVLWTLTAFAAVGNAPCWAAVPAPVLLSDPPSLEALRLAGDPKVIGRTLREADRALQQEALSVMLKRGIAPSGDKHDYYSLAVYSWPDPGQPGGPYRSRDGRRNPAADGPMYDRRAWGLMVSSVSSLAAGWALSRDERYAAKADALLRAWFLDPATRMNPNLEFGQVQPGHWKQHNGIIDTADLPRLVDSIALLSSSPALTAGDRAGLKLWMSDYLDWLLNSRPGREECAAGNNRGVWYDAQVAALAVFAGQSARARSSLERARRRLQAQVAPDGGLPAELKRTKSLHYSVYAVRAFVCCARLGENNGVDLWSEPGLRRALAFLAPYADPDKPWPYPELGRRDGRDLAWLLVMASRPLHEPTWIGQARLAGWNPGETALRTALFR